MKEENRFLVTEIQGVHAYIDELGAAWLNAEDIARGLGFVMVRNERVTTCGRKIFAHKWQKNFRPLVGTNQIY